MSDLFYTTDADRRDQADRDRITLMKRQAAQPLKPTRPQQPCDVGLFSDDRLQSDLVDTVRRRG